MRTIAFPITSKCEESCSYCFRKPQRDVGLKEFQQMLSRALRDDPEISKVVITGGNPELNPDFWAICGEVKKQKLRLKVHSNYSKKKEWKKYVELCDEVAIPIDSLAKKQPFRSEKSSKNFLSALDFFLKNKIAVQVHTVVGKSNLHESIRVHDFLKSKGFFPPSPNSWKLFRLIAVDKLKAQELTDKEWFEVKKRFEGKNVRFVDNVLEYQ